MSSRTQTLTNEYQKSHGVPPEYTGAGISSKFTEVSYNQPHWKRKALIQQKYPEVKKLQVPDPVSVIHILFIVVSQLSIAYFLRNYSLLVNFLAGYCVGAIFDHAMWVLVHDATHDTIFASRTYNMLCLWLANVPLLFPSTIHFRHYHLLHHAYLNEAYNDPDVPGEWENKLLGGSALGKALWLFLFPIWQGIRITRFSSQPKVDMWLIGNVCIQLLTAYLVYTYAGLMPLFYLFISTMFAVGLHPVGARWVAEHYAVEPLQETYSYYGILNRVSYNIGYHNEHHDLPAVPWSKLPAVKRLAPEFYDNLETHDSYLGVLFKFLFTPRFSLETRVIRRSKKQK